MRRRIHSLTEIATVAVIVVAAMRPAAADADPAALEQAKAHNRAAESHYAAERYPEAIVEYRKAYELVPRPLFIFNVAQAQRLARQYEAAIASYEQFIDLEPSHRLVPEARDHIAEIEAALRDRRAKTEPMKQPAAADFAAADNAPAPMEMGEPGAPDAPDSSAGSGLKIGGVAAALLGVVAGGASVYYAIEVEGVERDMASIREDNETDPRIQPGGRLDRKGRRYRRNAIAAGIAGGALVVTGGVLYYLGHRADTEQQRRLTVAPTVSPNAAGVQLKVSF